MEVLIHRRRALINAGLALAAGAAASFTQAKAEEADAGMLPAGARTLRDLADRLAKAPRRRDFKTVPMILDNPALWDHEALSEVIAYRGNGKQVYDNTAIASGFLNMMRNALNAQVFAFRNPDFFVASATHGTAHLALFDQAMWDKYQFAKRAGSNVETNTLAEGPKAAFKDPSDHEDPEGAYSSANSSIPALQQRGGVFLACHNAIWALSQGLVSTGVNPDKLSHEAMAAELTNHLIPGVVLTPGISATIPEMQRAGFDYIKS